MTRLLPLALLALAACGPRTLKVVMNAENNSGQSGLATLTDLGSTARIELKIGKSDDPRAEPAHVHLGRCGEIGAIVAALQFPVALEGDPDHFGSTSEVAMAWADLTNGNYALNVHDSRDHSLYVSCGDIN